MIAADTFSLPKGVFNEDALVDTETVIRAEGTPADLAGASKGWTARTSLPTTNFIFLGNSFGDKEPASFPGNSGILPV